MPTGRPASGISIAGARRPGHDTRVVIDGRGGLPKRSFTAQTAGTSLASVPETMNGTLIRTALATAALAVIAGCGTRPLDPEDVNPGDDGGARGDDGGTGGPNVVSIGEYTPGPCLQPATDPALARFQVGIVGRWMGTVTPPAGWDWSDGTVEFVFHCDGHYQSRCDAAGGRAPESCVALYYGSDGDDPSKTYEINDVRAD